MAEIPDEINWVERKMNKLLELGKSTIDKQMFYKMWKSFEDLEIAIAMHTRIYLP